MSDPFAAPDSGDSTMFVEPKRTRLRRIGLLSAGLFSASAGVIFGLLFGIIALFAAALGALNDPGGQNTPALLGFGVGMLVGVPLFYGFAGLVGGIINAVIYNILAGITGGIEMEFTDS